jgi:hypothetical protein
MGFNMDATGRERPAKPEPAADALGDTQGTGIPDVASVAEIVGEVSESAERPSEGRPVTEAARSALARVARGGANATRRGTSAVRRRPDSARQGPDAARGPDAATQGPDAARRGTGIARGGTSMARRGTSAAARVPRLAGRGVQASTRWLAGEVLALAPRLPVRDQATLRTQFPGKSPDELADTLIEGAARASAAIGATIGVWSVLPVAPAFPAEIVTETLTLVGIEIKLIAELHEVYDARPPGDLVSRMTAYVGAWAHRRGVTLTPGGVVLAMGSPLGRRLQRRLAVRAARSAFSLGPLLTGAAAGALFNRRETRRLGGEIRGDLRKRSSLGASWPH